jgi:pyroglutamyl-peptidase
MGNEKLLLTGFEPFGKWAVNPSWEIARALDGQEINGVRVVARRLPVDWQCSWPTLLKAIEETRPRWVLMLGQAARRPSISVESRGCNRCNGKPDNKGNAPTATTVDEEGPEELAATLPVEEIVTRISDSGVPVERSEDAGGYLCNHTLYRALAWAESQQQAPAIGFIHVPGLPSEDEEHPGMPLADMQRAAHAAIEAIADTSRTPASVRTAV